MMDGQDLLYLLVQRARFCYLAHSLTQLQLVLAWSEKVKTTTAASNTRSE